MLFHWFVFVVPFFLIHIHSITVNVYVVWMSSAEHAYLNSQGKKGCTAITGSCRLLCILVRCFAVWIWQGDVFLLQFALCTPVFTDPNVCWQLEKWLQSYHLFESNFIYPFLNNFTSKSNFGRILQFLDHEAAWDPWHIYYIQNCWFLLRKVCLRSQCETIPKSWWGLVNMVL